VIGGFVLRTVYAKVVDELLGTPFHNPHVSSFRAGLTEMVFTFFFIFIVMACLFDDRRRGKQLFGLAVGFAYGAALLASYTMTGAGLNPAKYFASALAAGALNQAGVYLVAPLVGAAVASIAYRFLFLGGMAAGEEEA